METEHTELGEGVTTPPSPSKTHSETWMSKPKVFKNDLESPYWAVYCRSCKLFETAYESQEQGFNRAYRHANSARHKSRVAR
jgi:hypothetical protein